MWLYSPESFPERVEMRDGGERDLETNKHFKSKGQGFLRNPGHNSINGSHRARIPPAFTVQGQNLIILPLLFLLQQLSLVACKPQFISVWRMADVSQSCGAPTLSFFWCHSCLKLEGLTSRGVGEMHLSTAFSTIVLSRIYMLWKRTGCLGSSPSFAEAVREMKENSQKISRAGSEIIAQRWIIRSCGFDITLNPDSEILTSGTPA